MLKPERTYKSFTDFIVKHRRPYRNSDPTFYHCTLCFGKGWDHRWEDHDPVEGFKLAPRYTCQKCGGSGRGTRKELKALYDEWRANYNAKVAEWERVEAIRRTAIAKLTPEERQVLGLD